MTWHLYWAWNDGQERGKDRARETFRVERTEYADAQGWTGKVEQGGALGETGDASNIMLKIRSFILAVKRTAGSETRTGPHGSCAVGRARDSRDRDRGERRQGRLAGSRHNPGRVPWLA